MNYHNHDQVFRPGWIVIAAVQVKTKLSSFQIWLDMQSCKQSQSSIWSSTITITIIILMQTITIIIIILKKYLKILILLMMKTIPFPLNICTEVFLSLCFVSFNPSHCQLEHWLVLHFLSTAKPSKNSFTPMKLEYTRNSGTKNMSLAFAANRGGKGHVHLCNFLNCNSLSVCFISWE